MEWTLAEIHGDHLSQNGPKTVHSYQRRIRGLKSESGVAIWGAADDGELPSFDHGPSARLASCSSASSRGSPSNSISKQERRIVARYATVAWDAKCDAIRKLHIDLRVGEVVTLEDRRS